MARWLLLVSLVAASSVVRADAHEGGLALDPPRALRLPTVPNAYLVVTSDAFGPPSDVSSEPMLEARPALEASSTPRVLPEATPATEATTERPTGRHFGASIGGVLLGAMATGAIVGAVSAFENHDGRGRDLTLAIAGPVLLTAGATWALHRLAEARGEQVRLVPVVVGALLSASAALAGVFVSTSARNEPFVGRHWAWAAPAVALATGLGAWVAHRATHGPRVQPSVSVSNRGVAGHLRVGFRR
ncbi:MAG: hypothetical protein H6724_02520 [Sandaracinus sp.]|nr:hypothetical protein [Myxococcales bacterium]MCB9618308.1 hypothetical protein [Sandaracinus sp.]MCB9622177.1 hypothetical protein [Sandaracinus sp.]